MFLSEEREKERADLLGDDSSYALDELQWPK
jgi:hypothetical protein